MNTLTRQEAKQLLNQLPIAKAWAEGSIIQYKREGTGEWVDANPHAPLGFVFSGFSYRVKPREIFAIYKNGQFDTTRLDRASCQVYIDGYNSSTRFMTPAKFEIVKMVEAA